MGHIKVKVRYSDMIKRIDIIINETQLRHEPNSPDSLLCFLLYFGHILSLWKNLNQIIILYILFK